MPLDIESNEDKKALVSQGLFHFCAGIVRFEIGIETGAQLERLMGTILRSFGLASR